MIRGPDLGRAALVAAGLLLAITAPARAGTTERVSISTSGVTAGGRQGNGYSGDGGVAISADGRFVAFNSDATNLVPGDTNGAADIFIHDRKTGRTERVSVGPRGVQANGSSGEYGVAISADGRFVAFTSRATNLVPGDTNGVQDVFVRDRLKGTTERVSVGPSGAQAEGGAFGSSLPAMSADGRFVAFVSDASNLVPGDTNGLGDIFVRDRRLGKTTRVDVGPDGVQADGYSDTPAISADGRFVAFTSGASNLAAGDRNRLPDVFVHERETGKTERVSIGGGVVQKNGGGGAPAISADGRYVAFGSLSGTGDPEVFVRDRQQRTTELVSIGPDGNPAGQYYTSNPSISAYGRFVAFLSNSISDDGTYHIYIRDRLRGTTELASVGQGGVPGDYPGSDPPAISADGRSVAFPSYSDNLVPRDTNQALDVFVHTR